MIVECINPGGSWLAGKIGELTNPEYAKVAAEARLFAVVSKLRKAGTIDANTGNVFVSTDRLGCLPELPVEKIAASVRSDNGSTVIIYSRGWDNPTQSNHRFTLDIVEFTLGATGGLTKLTRERFGSNFHAGKDVFHPEGGEQSISDARQAAKAINHVAAILKHVANPPRK